MNTPEHRSTRPSLRRRLLLGLLGYVALLSVAVAIHGLLVNEHAEQLVWQTLLNTELDHLQERVAADPGYQWVDTSNMALYDSRQPRTVPAELETLPAGVHDGIEVNGEERVVLVRQQGDHRSILSLDISELEEREADMTLTVIGSAITLLVLLGLLSAWGASRLVEPLTLMARQIGQLRPDQQGQELRLPKGATVELEVIGHALNDYLSRNDRFVERERLFVDMASHELRTPIAVIAGATELALQTEGTPAAARVLLDRIRSATKDVQELISLLLALAKDPARLRRAGERIALEDLLPVIVEDHRFLAEHKDLLISVEASQPVELFAPVQIVRAAIGNLLRNAIEHSDRGKILMRLEAPATITIQDPGHGMSPEEISAAYSRIARGGGGDRGQGIGLDLIARLCEHLGWTLEITSGADHGTTTMLRLAPEETVGG